MVVCRHFGYILIGPTFKGQAVPEEFCPETPVNIYQHTVRNIPEERRLGLQHYDESVKSLTFVGIFLFFPCYISSPSYPLHFGCLKGMVKCKLKKYVPSELTQLVRRFWFVVASAISHSSVFSTPPPQFRFNSFASDIGTYSNTVKRMSSIRGNPQVYFLLNAVGNIASIGWCLSHVGVFELSLFGGIQ